MSISQSLNNAVTGLTAASRSAELVSNNVANVNTEGYGRREIELSARALGSHGAGVTIEGVARMVDQTILRDRRLADASAAESDTRARFFVQLERLMGTPDDPSSLAGRTATLEASLVEAASRPDSQPRLQSVVDAAVALANQYNRVADGIQQARLDAETAIAVQVRDLNSALGQVQQLNERIVRAEQIDRNSSALLDQRQKILDQIAAIVPIKTIQHDFGRIEIRTMNGTSLVDRDAAKMGFSRANTIVADMTLASGALQGLTINGKPVSVSGNRAPLAGGSLSAQFELRDELAVEAQMQLDAAARDLTDRFANPTVDPTLAPGAPGFFTDAGAALDPLDEAGFAARISVSTLVRPEQGGALFRVREGLGATVEGDVGNAAQIHRLSDAMTLRRVPSSGPFAAARSASGLTADLLSNVGSNRRSAENEQSFTAAQAAHLKSLQLADGVDTDQEMQKLLLIEQAYAANARVISVADEMIRRLMEI